MPAISYLESFLRYRLDAVCLVLLSLTACYLCRKRVEKSGAGPEFSRATCIVTFFLAIGGALFAEWVGGALEFPIDSRVTTLAVTRAVALGGMGFLIGILLTNATLLAVMRAEIRQRAETERELHTAKIVADEANRAKGDFLAVMSHEIRTPLNAVMGFANLLADTKLDETQRGYLSTITGEGARLTSLINDILDLSKIEEGRLVLERLPYAPVEVAQEVLRLLAARAQEKKIDLRFEAQVLNPLLIAGDALRFRQIILNLLDNAIKFTPRGQVTLYLKWDASIDGGAEGQLEVRVRDTGIGIAEEKQKKLFQMFMQADASTTRRFGGTGLGLAICQRLVSLMSGEIKVKSEPGAGSEFSFSLTATPVALPDEKPEEAPAAVVIDGRRPSILVVDDMETNRFLLEVFLQRHGFDPQLAAGGEEAIRLALNNRYDAILMDLTMPDLDGYTATRRIREAETEGRHTPIIALTASTTKGTRELCLAAGMDEHMTKPLDLRKFRTLLSNLLAVAPAPATSPTARSIPMAHG